MWLEVNRANVLEFFRSRPQGVSPAFVEDTAGLDTPVARDVIGALIEDGQLEMRAGLYFVRSAALGESNSDPYKD